MQATRENIKSALKQKEKTLKWLCEQMGMPTRTFYNHLTNGFTVSELFYMSYLLGVEFEWMKTKV